MDGWVFAMLLVSGFAKMSSKIDELNTINVFPIADGDTGENTILIPDTVMASYVMNLY